MAGIRVVEVLSGVSILSGESVVVEAVNQVEAQPDGRYAVQYSKTLGVGKLKVTYQVSVNGEDFYTPDGAYAVIEESASAAGGLGELRPPMAPYIKLKVEAVGGDIDNLNLWMAIQ